MTAPDRRVDALDVLRDEARAALDEATSRELRDVSPDFAAVIEAAHARDPQRVSRAALDEALALAPIVPLGAESSQRRSTRDDAELGALLAEVRGEVDAEIAALRRAGFPPVPVPPARQVVVRRRWLWGPVAAAAAVLLAVASPMLATRLAPSQAGPTQAAMERAADRSHAADHEEPSPALPRPARPAPELTPPESEQEPTPDEIDTDISSVTPELGTSVQDPTPAEQPAPKARKPRPTASLAEQLRELDAEAESAWQTGDYAGAERRFRQIVALAPGSRAADLSYGDLFTLARQRSGPEQEKALWREYLAAFPRGRYADDARAGLCRRADPGKRSACWQQYLHDFPAGVHRPQAARALEPPDPAP